MNNFLTFEERANMPDEVDGKKKCHQCKTYFAPKTLKNHKRTCKFDPQLVSLRAQSDRSAAATESENSSPVPTESENSSPVPMESENSSEVISILSEPDDYCQVPGASKKMLLECSRNLELSLNVSNQPLEDSSLIERSGAPSKNLNSGSSLDHNSCPHDSDLCLQSAHFFSKELPDFESGSGSSSEDISIVAENPVDSHWIFDDKTVKLRRVEVVLSPISLDDVSTENAFAKIVTVNDLKLLESLEKEEDHDRGANLIKELNDIQGQLEGVIERRKERDEEDENIMKIYTKWQNKKKGTCWLTPTVQQQGYVKPSSDLEEKRRIVWRRIRPFIRSKGLSMTNLFYLTDENFIENFITTDHVLELNSITGYLRYHILLSS